MPAMKENDPERHAIQLFRKHGGIMRMSAALRAGIARRTLYALRDAGRLELLARGLYRLTDGAPLANPDLVTVAAKVPQGVLCLISALAFHEMTTQIPHEIWLAIPRNSEPPRLDFPPLRVMRMSGAAFTEGIDSPEIDGMAIRVYSREKTLADCFKYRNTLGLETVLEAVRMYKALGQTNPTALVQALTVCRVARVARPYLEAIL